MADFNDGMELALVNAFAGFAKGLDPANEIKTDMAQVMIKDQETGADDRRGKLLRKDMDYILELRKKQAEAPADLQGFYTSSINLLEQRWKMMAGLQN